jgi:hypothetical protein
LRTKYTTTMIAPITMKLRAMIMGRYDFVVFSAGGGACGCGAPGVGSPGADELGSGSRAAGGDIGGV